MSDATDLAKPGALRVVSSPKSRTYSVYEGDRYVAGGFWTRDAAERYVQQATQ